MDKENTGVQKGGSENKLSEPPFGIELFEGEVFAFNVTVIVSIVNVTPAVIAAVYGYFCAVRDSGYNRCAC